MTQTNRVARPLSPHLQVFRLFITMLVSGLHRITGFGMTLTAVLVVWWFVAAATSPTYFAFVDGLLTSWIGMAVMLASLLGLCLHLLNGIRHLIWDTGSYLGVKTSTRTAWFTLLGAPVLAIVTLAIILLT